MLIKLISRLLDIVIDEHPLESVYLLEFNNMDEYSTAATEDKEVAVISDSEEEDSNDGIVEILDGSPRITLPPEVWANVIECEYHTCLIYNYISYVFNTNPSFYLRLVVLPYNSLTSCAATSRTMLCDALPLVTTLYIKRAYQLRTGIVSRHLRDVRSVTIYNLFYRFSDRFYMDDEIATQSVRFLSLLPNLESVTFWGRDGNRLRSLNSMRLHINNPSITSQLLESFSSAFDYGGLPTHLQINGLRCPWKNTNCCKICQRICDKFPLKSISDIDLCLPYAISNEIIKAREGGRDYLHSETRLLQLLGKGRMKSFHNDCCIIEYESKVQGELKRFVESTQLDMAMLNQEHVLKAIKKQYPKNISVYLSEESFDYLKSTIRVPIDNALLDPMAVRVENLEHMVKHIMEETSLLQESMDQMSNLLQQQDPPIQRALESGVLLPKLIEFLSRDNDNDLQLTAMIILDVAAVEREHVEDIVKLGAVPSYVHLLSSPDSQITISAAWAVGNISNKTPHYTDFVLQAGAMQPLLKLFEDHQTIDVESVRYYTWALFKICTSTPRPDFNITKCSLPVLNGLLHHSDERVLINACWALRDLLYDDKVDTYAVKALIDAFDDTGIPRLVELMEYPTTNENLPAMRTVIQLAAMKVLINIAGGNDSHIQIIIDNNVLPSLLNLLSSTSAYILHDACSMISNITAGTVDQIQAVIDSDIIPEVVSLLKDDCSANTRNEAACVIVNVTQYGSAKQVEYLVTQGCIPLLLDLLNDLLESTVSVLTAEIQKTLKVLEAHINNGKDE